MPKGIIDNLEGYDLKGIETNARKFVNLTPEELVEEAIRQGQGVLADNGALCIETGKYTGRSPQDRFIVRDEITENRVDWGKINKPIEASYFEGLFQKMKSYLSDKDLFIRDAYTCADRTYQMNLRIITEYPWSNQFAYNMFLRPSESELNGFKPDWFVVCAPGFQGDPAIDGLRRGNFAIINFRKRMILIGGTGYTGEIKKGVFSVLNFVLPETFGVLPMHCSANVGKDGDVAIFFGLSGTGKTTLSTDPDRPLIGDDEHGWSEKGIFNFEGGCYAKCINLSEKKEPGIYRAIRHKAILENIQFFPDTRTPDYDSDAITQNTRVSYPISHIENALQKSMGRPPENVFFLSCDAFGVLPPLAKLNPEQAMYYFLSGYTAKVAGTEDGINDPETTFSACFGSPFLPLNPIEYTRMLGEKLRDSKAQVWLVNTGWTGGSFGKGKRISLKHTRQLIQTALAGGFRDVSFRKIEPFGLEIPAACPGVPDGILDPKNTWESKADFDRVAAKLSEAFAKNLEKYDLSSILKSSKMSASSV